MFSRRVPATLEPNRYSQALEAARRAGTPLLDLTVTNPTRVGLTYPSEELLAALQDPRALTYEPEPRGLRQAREAVSAYYAGKGASISPDHVFLAGSTSELYGWLFQLLCNPGDQVLIPAPSYPLFDCLASLNAVELSPYRLEESAGWQPDFESLNHAVTPRTRAIILVHPNNPTGSYWQERHANAIKCWAASHGLALIVDEVFLDYAWGPDPKRAGTFAGNSPALTFCLSGLSKLAGLPQMKLGWCTVTGAEPLREDTLQRLEWIADAYLPVSAPVQHAAPHWLQLAPQIRQAILERVQTNRARLAGLPAAVPAVRTLPAEGGWSAILEVPRTRTDEEWALAALEEQGIVLQPGFFYDLDREGLLVTSLLPPVSTWEQSVSKLTELFR